MTLNSEQVEKVIEALRIGLEYVKPSEWPRGPDMESSMIDEALAILTPSESVETEEDDYDVALKILSLGNSQSTPGVIADIIQRYAESQVAAAREHGAREERERLGIQLCTRLDNESGCHAKSGFICWNGIQCAAIMGDSGKVEK